MAKPLDQFGGWLKFYYVMQWIAVFLAVTGIMLMLATIASKSNAERLYIQLLVLESIIAIIILVLIQRCVKIKDPTIPKRIINLLLVLLGVALVFTVFQALAVYYFPYPGIDIAKELKDLSRHAASSASTCAIWISYFKKSRRVAAYYESIPKVTT